VFLQPLRQTEGLLRSIANVLELDIAIPDHTTLSRRAGGLTILPKTIGRGEPLPLLVDSTGLTIYSEGEWLDQKRGIRSPRRWRKLRLGVDADTHEIVAAELTADDVGDMSESPGLLDQIDAEIASFTADGAYDSEVVYDAVANRHPDARIIIPPRATAVTNETPVTQRDRHIILGALMTDSFCHRENTAFSIGCAAAEESIVRAPGITTIEKPGRMGWQRRSGYNRRSLVETALYRYKTIIGRRLQARNCLHSGPRQRRDVTCAIG
jgi:hypothetical protein